MHEPYRTAHKCYNSPQIANMYYGIPRSVVKKFTSLCTTCQLRQPQITKPPLQPIIAVGFCHGFRYAISYMLTKYSCHWSLTNCLSRAHCFFCHYRLIWSICGICQMANIIGSCMRWTIGPSSILLTHLRASMHLASLLHSTATCFLTLEFPEFCILTMAVSLSTMSWKDC